MYEVGMYGGSFNPLHQGHVQCIIEAANQCKVLNIIISNGLNRNEIDIRERYRWIYQLTKHIGNVKIHILVDDASSKESYTQMYWHDDAIIVKGMIGKKIDVVFCGDDYDDTGFYAKCYPKSEIWYLKRNEISSTKIRSNPYKYWEWMPRIVQTHYVKKVLLIGGESVGKSTLTINLAHYYNTNYLEEVGRELSVKSGTDVLMISEDFTEILLKHKAKEMDLIHQSNRILFIDTDCLITKFYIRFLKDKGKEQNEHLVDAISAINKYDLVLFLEPDVEFVQDGDRSKEIRDNRLKYSNQLKELFEEQGFTYECISGDYQTRFKSSIKMIDMLFEDSIT